MNQHNVKKKKKGENQEKKNPKSKNFVNPIQRWNQKNIHGITLNYFGKQYTNKYINIYINIYIEKNATLASTWKKKKKNLTFPFSNQRMIKNRKEKIKRWRSYGKIAYLCRPRWEAFDLSKNKIPQAERLPLILQVRSFFTPRSHGGSENPNPISISCNNLAVRWIWPDNERERNG